MTAVVATVAVPATSVTDPNEFAPAAVVVPTLVLKTLFPAVPNTKFPFVAVIAPSVAVREVEAVREPVTAVFPVALPIFTAPVPPVPIVVTPAPDAFKLAVPTCVNAASVVAPVTPSVVPTVAEVPAANVVVEAIDPGATNVDGTERVSVLPDPVVVTSFVVPRILMLPAEGVSAPPESPVSVASVDVAPEGSQDAVINPLVAAKLVKV